MQISGIRFNTPQFCAKRKDIRTADDICRRAKASFPLFSPTYVSEFWISYKMPPVSIYNKVKRKAIDLNDGVQRERKIRKDKLNEHRIARHLNKTDEDFLIAYLDTLKDSSIGKIGNCGENSKIALAGLIANGFYNSSMASLYYRVSMIDKKTGEEIISQETDMDHSLAITDMNKGGEKDIVVDPWLGFAGHKTKAFDIFNALFLGKVTDQAEKDCLNAFKRNMEYRNIKYNEDDYYMKKGFVFMPHTTYDTNYEKEIANKQLREKFPELIVKSVK